MADPVTGPDAGEHGGLFVLMIRRDQHEERLADCLRRSVAGDALGSVVPRGDGAVERLADDRVVGGLDDRRQQRRGGMRGARSGRTG